MSEDNICCICNHGLDVHLDEKTGWRCHSLGGDGYQCECWLRKDRAEDDIDYYDIKERAKTYVEEEQEQLRKIQREERIERNRNPLS